MPATLASEAIPTPRDRRQLRERGISIQAFEQQLATFRRGTSFTQLKKPCVINDGIHRVRPASVPTLIQRFEQSMAAGRVTQFVPASGAATRMFQALQACRLKTHSSRGSASDQRVLEQCLSSLSKFAFYHDLKNALSRQGCQLDHLVSEGRHHQILDALLHEPGLNYAKLPKGLLAFHRYPRAPRTPIEEHLVEAAACANDDKGHARLHLTTAPEHREAIQRHIEQARQKLAQYAVTWKVGCSIQKSSTDTFAVDVDNQPFHDSRGNLLFRPAGHGALLSNLDELHGDIVLIKNIDNVVHDHHKAAAYRSKKTLGGLLLNLQDTLFSFLTQLESQSVSSALLGQITKWARRSLAMTLPDKWNTFANDQQAQWLITWLNRPLRVCGMVPDTGDAGGGPFWVEPNDGASSLQIVDHAQVDPDSPTQQAIFKSATHFNPVDIVCGVRDYKGHAFNLHQFGDAAAGGFILQKSHEGRTLKALERSGLWNGAMSAWHSVFVEVPRHTFNPAKTVLDLLLPAHQPSKRT